MAVKAVVFDLDGLMFNTEDVFDLSGNELLVRRGLKMTDEIRNAMIGRRAVEAFTNMLAITGLDEAIPDLERESKEIFFSLLDEHLKPMDGLFELLDHLEQRNLPRAVATSSSRTYLEELLGRFDLLERFRFFLTSEDVSQGKPHPEIYQKAAAKLEIAPGEMIVLEDTQAGTTAAAKAGAIAVSVPHRHTAGHDFSLASHVIQSLADRELYRLLEA